MGFERRFPPDPRRPRRRRPDERRAGRRPSRRPRIPVPAVSRSRPVSSRDASPVSNRRAAIRRPTISWERSRFDRLGHAVEVEYVVLVDYRVEYILLGFLVDLFVCGTGNPFRFGLAGAACRDPDDVDPRPGEALPPLPVLPDRLPPPPRLRPLRPEPRRRRERIRRNREWPYGSVPGFLDLVFLLVLVHVLRFDVDFGRFEAFFPPIGTAPAFFSGRFAQFLDGRFVVFLLVLVLLGFRRKFDVLGVGHDLIEQIGLIRFGGGPQPGG